MLPMNLEKLSAAIHRAQTVLRRRPDMGVHDDSPVTSRWQGGTRVVSRHENGTEIASDMPSELGGSGDHVTPGWLFRAGLASCAATSIAMTAAAEAIELTTLEVRVTSRSDARGLLNMTDERGALIYAGPSDLQLHVRISASNATPERLRALVEAACRCSPIPNVVQNAAPLELQIEVADP
jgi:uncharacterized OsmC-like protein